MIRDAQRLRSPESDPEHQGGPDGRSGVKAPFTPQLRPIEDRALGIVRQIQAMARRFEGGQEDQEALVSTQWILAAAEDLQARAMEALHSSGQYSNAEMADVLGISRQAVSQRRLRHVRARESKLDVPRSQA